MLSKEIERFVPKEEQQELLNLTEFDFRKAGLYMSNPKDTPLQAEQLTFELVIKRSWGIQEMKPGDWVVYKPGPDEFVETIISGVRKEAFEATYVKDDIPHFYKKKAFVRAMQIDKPFCFLGVDSDELEVAPAGSYITLNLDKDQKPIIINGRRDMFFYKEGDLFRRYIKVDSTGFRDWLDTVLACIR